MKSSVNLIIIEMLKIKLNDFQLNDIFMLE